MRVLPWTRRRDQTATRPDPVAALKDEDVLHLVCCCDDNTARCGEDVADAPWGTEGIPLPDVLHPRRRAMQPLWMRE